MCYFVFTSIILPRAFSAAVECLDEQTKEQPPIVEFLDYLTRTWIPKNSYSAKKCSLSSLTNTFRSDDVLLTNNDSETYNYRTKQHQKMQFIDNVRKRTNKRLLRQPLEILLSQEKDDEIKCECFLIHEICILHYIVLS